MEESKGRVKVHLPKDHPTPRRNIEGITHLLNVTNFIRWDTLLDIVLLTKISVRRRTGSTMPMQLKKMNQTRKGSQKIKTLEEYVLISALTSAITHGSDTWLIESGASKHMIGHKDSLSCLTQKDIFSQGTTWR